MEYSKLASGSILSNGGPTAVNLPFLPNYIEISNSTRAAAVSGVTRAWWETDMGQGAAFLTTTAAGPVDGTSFVSATTGGGFLTFESGISLLYGPTIFLGASGGITKASPGVVTTTAPHGLVSGNVVVFQNLYASSSTGMQQIAAIPFVVTVLSATTFSIPWNTNQSNYTAIAAGGLNMAASFKQLYTPNLYAPNLGFISAITTGASTTIFTTAPTNIQVGQEVAFRVPTAWGTVQLNSLPNVFIPGSPHYGFVTSVVSPTQFVVNINSLAYTAYNSNQTFASVLAGGFNVPQVVGVGDANSGSNQLNFLPPMFYNGTTTGLVSSINGPAIQGAFCNNTSRGFIFGAAVAGMLGDQIYWRAYAHDYNV